MGGRRRAPKFPSSSGIGLVDPGVEIDDDIDGCHEDFGGDKDNDCGEVRHAVSSTKIRILGGREKSGMLLRNLEGVGVVY